MCQSQKVVVDVLLGTVSMDVTASLAIKKKKAAVITIDDATTTDTTNTVPPYRR